MSEVTGDEIRAAGIDPGLVTCNPPDAYWAFVLTRPDGAGYVAFGKHEDTGEAGFAFMVYNGRMRIERRDRAATVADLLAIVARYASPGKSPCPVLCPGRARHWRIAFGTTGLRTPVCVYCGNPNPRPLADREWRELIDWSRTARMGKHVRAAIEAREALAEGGKA